MVRSTKRRGWCVVLLVVAAGCPAPQDDVVETEPDAAVEGPPPLNSCTLHLFGGTLGFTGAQGERAAQASASYADAPSPGRTLLRFQASPQVLLASYEGKPAVGPAPATLAYTENGDWRSAHAGALVVDAIDGSTVTLHIDDVAMVPAACQLKGYDCGYAPDVCGGKAPCGLCPSGQKCGGMGTSGGRPNVCAAGKCTPLTCQQQGKNCGVISDTCASTFDCGKCTVPGETCGGGGTPNVCGKAPCTAQTCGLPGRCGRMPDGCGQFLNCPGCGTGTCGGGGFPNVCGAGSCTPKTCAQEGLDCGSLSDGCGDWLTCGTCPAGQACGAGGIDNVCAVDPAQTCTVAPGTFTLGMASCRVAISGL